MRAKSEILKGHIKELLKNGFKVYRNAEQDPTTYVFIEKGNNIGYIQTDDFLGCLHFSTVHKPNSKTGTGYGMNDEAVCEPTIKDAESTFVFKPHWSRAKNVDIKKYKSFDDYRKDSNNSFMNYAEVKEKDLNRRK